MEVKEKESTRNIDVLVVDDDPDIRELLGEIVHLGGYQARLAESGKEALRLMKEKEPSLVISDVMMPEMDGVTLLKKIIKSYHLIPVIMVTGNNSAELAVKALKLGAFHFVRKPFDIKEIRSLIKKAIEYKVIETASVKLADYSRHAIRIRFPSESKNIDGVIRQICNVCNTMNFPPGLVKFNIALSLTEALANAVQHGNKEDPEKWITVMALIRPKKLKIWIRDQGDGFETEQIPDPTKKENLFNSRGRGILLMNYYMDKVKFLDHGQCIYMMKVLMDNLS